MYRRRPSIDVYVRNKNRYDPSTKGKDFLCVNVTDFAGTTIGDIKEEVKRRCKNTLKIDDLFLDNSPLDDDRSVAHFNLEDGTILETTSNPFWATCMYIKYIEVERERKAKPNDSHTQKWTFMSLARKRTLLSVLFNSKNEFPRQPPHFPTLEDFVAHLELIHKKGAVMNPNYTGRDLLLLYQDYYDHDVGRTDDPIGSFIHRQAVRLGYREPDPIMYNNRVDGDVQNIGERGRGRGDNNGPHPGPARQRIQGRQKVCEDCEAGEADVYCGQCQNASGGLGLALCQGCSQALHVGAARRRHVITDIEQAPKTTKPYTPHAFKAPFSMLVALYSGFTARPPVLSMTEDEVKERAQPLTDTDLQDKQNGRYVGGFECMENTLMQKGFIQREDARNPTYALTHKGQDLAEQLFSFQQIVSRFLTSHGVPKIDIPLRLKTTCGRKKICLIIDEQERDRDRLLRIAAQRNVDAQVRQLPSGDYIWIVTPALADPEQKYTKQAPDQEQVLPFIVERKSWEDLQESVRTKRFHRQVNNMMKSGLKNLYYLMEGSVTCMRYKPSDEQQKKLKSAVESLMIRNGFYVNYTSSWFKSALWLVWMTSLVTEAYTQGQLDGQCISYTEYRRRTARHAVGADVVATDTRQGQTVVWPADQFIDHIYRERSGKGHVVETLRHGIQQKEGHKSVLVIQNLEQYNKKRQTTLNKCLEEVFGDLRHMPDRVENKLRPCLQNMLHYGIMSYWQLHVQVMASVYVVRTENDGDTQRIQQAVATNQDTYPQQGNLHVYGIGAGGRGAGTAGRGNRRGEGHRDPDQEPGGRNKGKGKGKGRRGKGKSVDDSRDRDLTDGEEVAHTEDAMFASDSQTEDFMIQQAMARSMQDTGDVYHDTDESDTHLDHQPRSNIATLDFPGNSSSQRSHDGDQLSTTGQDLSDIRPFSGRGQQLGYSDVAHAEDLESVDGHQVLHQEADVMGYNDMQGQRVKDMDSKASSTVTQDEEEQLRLAILQSLEDTPKLKVPGRDRHVGYQQSNVRSPKGKCLEKQAQSVRFGGDGNGQGEFATSRSHKQRDGDNGLGQVERSRTQKDDVIDDQGDGLLPADGLPQGDGLLSGDGLLPGDSQDEELLMILSLSKQEYKGSITTSQSRLSKVGDVHGSTRGSYDDPVLLIDSQDLDNHDSSPTPCLVSGTDVHSPVILIDSQNSQRQEYFHYSPDRDDENAYTTDESPGVGNRHTDGVGFTSDDLCQDRGEHRKNDFTVVPMDNCTEDVKFVDKSRDDSLIHRDKDANDVHESSTHVSSTHGSSTHVSSTHGSSTHGSSTHDSSTHDSSTHDPSTHDSSTHDCSTHDSSTHVSSTHDSSTCTHVSSTHDSSTHDTPHGARSKGLSTSQILASLMDSLVASNDVSLPEACGNKDNSTYSGDNKSEANNSCHSCVSDNSVKHESGTSVLYDTSQTLAGDIVTVNDLCSVDRTEHQTCHQDLLAHQAQYSDNADLDRLASVNLDKKNYSDQCVNSDETTTDRCNEEMSACDRKLESPGHSALCGWPTHHHSPFTSIIDARDECLNEDTDNSRILAQDSQEEPHCTDVIVKETQPEDDDDDVDVIPPSPEKSPRRGGPSNNLPQNTFRMSSKRLLGFGSTSTKSSSDVQKSCVPDNSSNKDSPGVGVWSKFPSARSPSVSPIMDKGVPPVSAILHTVADDEPEYNGSEPCHSGVDNAKDNFSAIWLDKTKENGASIPNSVDEQQSDEGSDDKEEEDSQDLMLCVCLLPPLSPSPLPDHSSPVSSLPSPTFNSPSPPPRNISPPIRRRSESPRGPTPPPLMKPYSSPKSPSLKVLPSPLMGGSLLSRTPHMLPSVLTSPKQTATSFAVGSPSPAKKVCPSTGTREGTNNGDRNLAGQYQRETTPQKSVKSTAGRENLSTVEERMVVQTGSRGSDPHRTGYGGMECHQSTGQAIFGTRSKQRIGVVVKTEPVDRAHLGNSSMNKHVSLGQADTSTGDGNNVSDAEVARKLQELFDREYEIAQSPKKSPERRQTRRHLTQSADTSTGRCENIVDTSKDALIAQQLQEQLMRGDNSASVPSIPLDNRLEKTDLYTWQKDSESQDEDLARRLQEDEERKVNQRLEEDEALARQLMEADQSQPDTARSLLKRHADPDPVAVVSSPKQSRRNVGQLGGVPGGSHAGAVGSQAGGVASVERMWHKKLFAMEKQAKKTTAEQLQAIRKEQNERYCMIKGSTSTPTGRSGLGPGSTTHRPHTAVFPWQRPRSPTHTNEEDSPYIDLHEDGYITAAPPRRPVSSSSFASQSSHPSSTLSSSTPHRSSGYQDHKSSQFSSTPSSSWDSWGDVPQSAPQRSASDLKDNPQSSQVSSTASSTPSSSSNVTCGNCGEKGHNRNSKGCRRYYSMEETQHREAKQEKARQRVEERVQQEKQMQDQLTNHQMALEDIVIRIQQEKDGLKDTIKTLDKKKKQRDKRKN